ncbi:hypothetical protein ABGV42_11165 [Paenibacillus pabuli]|uniref:hypothetical protein n=1 Tax=Paenibacillus pabuli TaxID=1472 RepID=UPI003242BFD4
MKNLWSPVIMLSALLFASGCSSSTYQITGYTSSTIHADFPVPENAILLGVTTNSANRNIQISASYELKHIGGEQGLYTPTDYFQKLHNEGWVEMEENRLGHVHFFQKEDTIIAIEIREDTFDIYEMKKDAPI